MYDCNQDVISIAYLSTKDYKIWISLREMNLN